MAKRRGKALPIAVFDDFSGGLNTYMSAAKIRDDESPNLQNIEFTENGIPSKRRGTDVYGNSDGTATRGMGSLYTSGGTRRHVRVKETGSAVTIQYYDAGVWTDVSGVSLTTAKNVNFVQALDALYAHNGTDTMTKWTGSGAATQPSTGVVGTFGIYYAGRHCIAGNTSNPSRIYMSSTKSADNFTGKTGTATAGAASTLTDGGQAWTTNEYSGLIIQITGGTGAGQSRTIASNTGTVITVSTAWTTNPDNTSQYSIEGGDTIDISKNDGQKVTGLAKFEDKLVIFKEHSIHQLTFDSSGFPTVQLLLSDSGCVAHRSIDAVENDIFYLDHSGVRSLGYVENIAGIIRTNVVSAKVQNETNNINATYYESCAAIYSDNKYILAFPQGSSTTNNRLLVFQTLYGAWSVWTGISANCFNEFIDTDNEMKLYYGDEGTGQVYQMLVENYTDGSATAIDAFWYSKQFDLGAFSQRKRFVFVDLQLRALTGTLSIDVITDGSAVTKMASLSSTFSEDDGLRVFKFREAQFREDAGSTASTVAIDDVRRIRVNTTARSLQNKDYNSSDVENFTLMGLAVGYRARSPYSFDSSKVIY